MTTPDRLPAILQAMQDAAHEAGDLILAAGIAHAVDIAELAPLLPISAGDVFQGEDLYAWASGAKERPADLASSPWCPRAAARLASTACLLLAVDPRGHEETAARLWAAAGRLAGIRPTAEAGRDDPIAAEADAFERAKQRVQAPSYLQVGDIIDAKDVPHRSIVECHNRDLVIRLPVGNGWTLDATGGPADSGGWVWGYGMPASIVPVRVMALDISTNECWQVAGMTPAEAREWLAQRVARETV